VAVAQFLDVRRLVQMEQRKKNLRWLRVAGALLLGLLLLMASVPSTLPGKGGMGAIIAHPGVLLLVVGYAIVVTACTVFGIVRRNYCEFVGWAWLVLSILGNIFKP